MNNMKSKIISTFLELSKDIPINKISINSIIKKANINRSTFYYYFENIDMLILELENELLDEFSKIQKVLFKSLIFGMNKKTINIIDNFINENEELITIFLIENQRINFMDKITKKAFDNILMMSKTDMKSLSKQQEYSLKYLINGQLWLFAYWIKNGKEIEINELIRIARHIITKGPLHSIFNKKTLK